jgi:hypothetical protein
MRRNGDQTLPPTLVLHSYSSDRHGRAVADARLDGLIQGFCWGLGAAGLTWFVLSGNLVRLLIAVVRSALALP